MTGLSFDEGLLWLLTIGLSTASMLVTGFLIKVAQDRAGHELTNVAKEYISYIVPFVLVLLAYGGRIAFGFVAFNIDSAFAFVLNAGTVAFGSQLMYTAIKSARSPKLLEATLSELQPATLRSLTEEELDQGWREQEPVDPADPDYPARIQAALQVRGRQGAPVPPEDREG